MDEQKTSVLSAWIKVFKSKKFMFLSIMFSICAALLVIDKIQNRVDLTSLTVLGFEINIADLLGEKIGAVLKVMNTIILILSLIPLIPQILIAVAFWMIRANSKNNPESVRKITLGLNIFKVHFFIQNGIYLAAVLLFIILAAIVVPALGVLKGADSLMILLYVILCAVVYAIILVLLMYYGGFLRLLDSTTLSIRTGKNFVYKEDNVFFSHWVIAIWGILTAFGKGFIGTINAICCAVCYIIINRCYASYFAECGSFDRKLWQKLPLEFRNNPEYRDMALHIGYEQNPEDPEGPLKHNLFKRWQYYTFGTKPLGYDSWAGMPEESVADVGSQSAKPAHATTRTESYKSPISKASCGYTVAPRGAVKNGGAAQGAPTGTAKRSNGGCDFSTAPVISARVLNLFSTNMDELDLRYNPVSSKVADKALSCPVTISRADVVEDCISEKKILRMQWIRRAQVPMRSVKLDVLFADEEGRGVGVCKDISFELDFSNADEVLGQYGIVMPADAVGGVVRVSFVELEDGLDWEKGGALFSFGGADTVADFSVETEQSDYRERADKTDTVCEDVHKDTVCFAEKETPAAHTEDTEEAESELLEKTAIKPADEKQSVLPLVLAIISAVLATVVVLLVLCSFY